MNYFLLAETEFFRRINEAGDCNMETAYTAFATQVIELCSGNVDTNRTIIALAYIEIELQHHPMRNLPEEKREVAAYISKALSLVRKMQKFLAAPQVPPLSPQSDHHHNMPTPAPAMRWTGKASDLIEILYGMVEMGCINDGEIQVGELAAFFYSLFKVEAKDCYRIYSDIKLRKNDSRTYFLDKMQEKLNKRMDMDEERERIRR